MICDFCGKIRNEILNRWVNNELGVEYKICDACVTKIKNGTFKE